MLVYLLSQRFALYFILLISVSAQQTSVKVTSGIGKRSLVKEIQAADMTTVI